MESGIYKITNIINSKVYYGSTINFNERKNSHFSKLENNNHVNKHLQSSYNLYGTDNFVFEPIQFVEDITRLFIVEQIYLDVFHDNGRMCYNIAKKAGEYSEETRKKLSEGHKGIKQSEEAKMKISVYRTGKKHSPETLEKMKIANQNPSIETRKKLSDSAKRRMAEKINSSNFEPNLNILTIMTQKAAEINRKPVKSINLITLEIKKFESIVSAAKYYNLTDSSISDVLKGKTKTAKKKTLRFEYVN